MNRIEYLKKTIDINFDSIQEFNSKNKNKFELSLCNYDSKDGLDEYIRRRFMNHINSGLLRYIKVNNKKYFHHAHAKNIAYKNSTGEVLINLDSDNHLRLEVLEHFNWVFSTYDINKIYLCDKKNIGLIGLSRYNFYKLGGYVELLVGYGQEDVDLTKRLEKYLSCEKIILSEDLNYNKTCTIHQTDGEKIKNLKKTVHLNPSKYLERNMDANHAIMDEFLEKGIMNPNKFKGINFGEL